VFKRERGVGRTMGQAARDASHKSRGDAVMVGDKVCQVQGQAVVMFGLKLEDKIDKGD
jgi:hypothetical protein